jgi:hypothetical protein
VQAFLKKNSKDNGYCRYRIQRYQSKNGGNWTKQENNLVKQNYLWADKQLNLTVVNFGVADTTSYNISQYMCLIYRGYDDYDHPLNCAWAETDKLVYDPSREMTQIIAEPENTQYIGYVECPPPYYLNNFGNVPDNYLNPSYEDISEVEFSTSSTSTTSSEIGYDVGGDLNFKSGFFSAGLSASFGQVWGSDYSKSIINTFNLVASEEDSAYYITSAPVINRAFYKIHDVHGTLIDSTYHFYMTDPHLNLEPANIGQGLIPWNPATYYQRGINFPTFNTSSYGHADNSWTGSAYLNPAISIDQSESQTNTITAKLDLGFELGEMFDIGIDGSFDYSLKTTTSVGNEMKSWTRLNAASAQNPTDVVHLNYTTYWINRVEGVNNWWLHEGALTQNTWCIMYDVTYIKYVNGTTIGSLSNPEPGEPVSVETITEQGSENMDQVAPTKSSLSQNYPNPFKPTTVIKYQIGIEDPQTNMENQGYQTKLAVYNLSGHQVALIVDEYKTAGSYEVNFDASQLTPGVYFYSLQSVSFSDVKKLILLK